MVMLKACLLTVVLTSGQAASNSVCRKTEFECGNKRCIPSNRFCNSANDCGDNTDEPRFCTPCNRTFYGEIGLTYEMEIHRPKIGQLPFTCSLSFSAAGGQYGDLVQITFVRFTLGKFVSFTSESGCKDGELQISESERPFVGGSWCGSSVKPTHYFSESSTVKLTIKLNKLPDDNTEYNYDIKLLYRVVSKQSSVIRYGGRPTGDIRISQQHQNKPQARNRTITTSTMDDGSSRQQYQDWSISTNSVEGKYFLGDLISGTYCSRIFSDCDRRDCRLQSPNFPGLYPRNLTCYYAIRQHAIPEGMHSLISIRQKNSQLISVQSMRYNTENDRETKLKYWTECDMVQDYLTVYDGYTTRDPILLKFCGGGSPLPQIISSGPELLIEFMSSPYGTMLNPTTLLPVHGFQLDVEVVFVEKESLTYSHNKRCEFWIHGNSNGVIESPKHSLPPNTTCLYHLQGHEPGSTPPTRYQDNLRSKTFSRYKVWLSVLKFHVAPKEEPKEMEMLIQKSEEEYDCSTRLRIWDTNIKEPVACVEPCNVTSGSLEGDNNRLLSTFCDNLIPKSCEHHLLGRPARPCSKWESYLSTKNTLTLELKTTESTVLRPVSFRVLYEFVDFHQDGEPWGEGRCSRKFPSRTQTSSNFPQRFRTPKDVFFYGRGGSPDLECILRFEAQRGENVKITINNIGFNNRTECVTRMNKNVRYAQCIGNDTASVKLSEVAFASENPLLKDCLCSENEQLLPFVYTSSSTIVHLHFSIFNMNFSDDFRRFFVEGTYEFVRTPVCTKNRIVSSSSGQIHFKAPSQTPEEVNCRRRPWMIKPSPSHYLYVKMHGVVIPGFGQVLENVSNQVAIGGCSTSNRFIIHSGQLHALVCPLPPPAQRHHIVEVFSEGWVVGTSALEKQTVEWGVPPHRRTNRSRSIIIEFLPQEAGSYYISWLELSKRRLVLPPEGMSLVPEECYYRCPELNGCINSSLWCDGIEHCPSGYDESFMHCFFLFQLPALYLILIGICSLLLICSSIIIGRRVYKLRTSPEEATSVDTEAIFGPREVIC